jgi:hypothetical protein
MTYPGAGIGVSTGSAWTTSLTAPSGTIVGTTDTQTLSGKTLTTPLIGNGATGGGYAEFREDTDNGTNYVRVQAPDALGADYVATLPAATGTLALISTDAYDASTWDASTLAPDQNAVRDYLESKLPSGADGSYGIVLTNNSAKSPTASTDEIYFEANIAKVNQNGTESSVVIGPTAGQVSFTGPTQARAFALPDSAETLLYSGGALGTPASGTLTNATGLPIAGLTASTSTALGVGSIELGHASDTTLARSAAGVVTIEGATILTNTTPAVIDGSTAATLTAAQMSDPRCHVSNYGQTTADVRITLPTAAANLSCLFEVDTAQAANHWGVLAGANDNITIIAADGTIGSAGSDAAAAVMTAAQIGQSFACWTARTGASAYDWRCKSIAIGTSTFAAHAAF